MIIANKKLISNANKPRKPPRPHHTTGSTSQSPEIRTVIDELLAETKTINTNVTKPIKIPLSLI